MWERGPGIAETLGRGGGGRDGSRDAWMGSDVLEMRFRQGPVESQGHKRLTIVYFSTL